MFLRNTCTIYFSKYTGIFSALMRLSRWRSSYHSDEPNVCLNSCFGSSSCVAYMWYILVCLFIRGKIDKTWWYPAQTSIGRHHALQHQQQRRFSCCDINLSISLEDAINPTYRAGQGQAIKKCQISTSHHRKSLFSTTANEKIVKQCSLAYFLLHKSLSLLISYADEKNPKQHWLIFFL